MTLSGGATERMPELGPKRGLVNTSLDSIYYSMSSHERGHCLVFNHVHFDPSLQMNERRGSEADAQAITKVFTKMGFKVHVFQDYTYRDFLQVLELYSVHVDHSAHDCLAVFFLSHGEEGSLYCRDKVFRQEKLFLPFEARNCPSLAGKPKLFFIQACRGQQLEQGVEMYEQTDSDGRFSHKVPSTADVFVLWSTTPGYYSWRNTANGSWFVQSLVHVFHKQSHLYPLHVLHAELNRYMMLNFQSNTPTDPNMHQMKQCCLLTSTGTRVMHFYPPSPSK